MTNSNAAAALLANERHPLLPQEKKDLDSGWLVEVCSCEGRHIKLVWRQVGEPNRSKSNIAQKKLVKSRHAANSSLVEHVALHRTALQRVFLPQPVRTTAMIDSILSALRSAKCKVSIFSSWRAGPKRTTKYS